MIYKYIVFTLLMALIIPQSAHAFLPPDLIVQGIASIGTVLLTAVVFIGAPMIGFVRFLKKKLTNRAVIRLIVINFIVILLISLLFYFVIYKPIYDGSPLFDKKGGSASLYDRTLESSDPSNLDNKYISNDGLLRDNKEKIIDYNLGLDIDGIKKISLSSKKLYYLDVREIEEYEVGHITGARHLRHADVVDINELWALFGVHESQMANSVIVVYCHDGDRGYFTSKKLNDDRIKYLIGGIENLQIDGTVKYTGSKFSDISLFGDRYQFKYQTSYDSFVNAINSNKSYLVVDFRLGSKFNQYHVKDSIHLLFNTMGSVEYSKRLDVVLKNRNGGILIVADRYAELFYANLFIKRLIDNYGYDESQFSILFNQSIKLKSDDKIKIEHGYPSI